MVCRPVLNMKPTNKDELIVYLAKRFCIPIAYDDAKKDEPNGGWEIQEETSAGDVLTMLMDLAAELFTKRRLSFGGKMIAMGPLVKTRFRIRT